MDRAFPKLITCLLMLSLTTDASAGGFRPFAISDSVTVFEGGTATVLDSGEESVLANDFDWEGIVVSTL